MPLGNSPGSGERELEWVRTGSPANGLGTASHHLSVAGNEAALLCRAKGLCGSPAPICPRCQWLSPVLVLLSLEWGCGKGSPSFTVWHCRVTPRDFPIPEQPNEPCPHHMCLEWDPCTREGSRLLPLKSCSRQYGRVMGHSRRRIRAAHTHQPWKLCQAADGVGEERGAGWCNGIQDSGCCGQ